MAGENIEELSRVVPRVIVARMPFAGCENDG